jgi:hypothetical protein
MYIINEYKNLTSRYSSYASWAIWNYENARDTAIIDQNFDQLHSNFVLLGLNISRPLTNKWSNFHDNSHARKLKYACNDSKLRGSYMTDIFKGIVKSRSTAFNKILTDNIVSENVNFFIQEMEDIGLNDESQFIIFGGLTAQYFNVYFKQKYKNHIIYYRHYSDFTLTDKEWVIGFWKELKINQDFDLTKKKFKIDYLG